MEICEVGTGLLQNDEMQQDHHVVTLLELLSSSTSSRPCIYRVPQHIRKIDPDSYTPSAISIGPYHSTDKYLICNSLKLIFLRDFIDCFKVPLEKIVETVIHFEDRARKYYAEPVDLSCDEFIELLVLDGCFVVMHMIKLLNLSSSFADQPCDTWKRFRVQISLDILLLENQLPMFLINSLFQLIPNHIISNIKPFATYVHNFVGMFDFLSDTWVSTYETEGRHFLDFQTLRLCSSTPLDMKTFEPPCFLPTATELHKCGVSFRIKRAQYSLDISFEDHGGYLQLPKINIHRRFERRMKNLLAYELCRGYDHGNQVSNFAMLMQYLVQSENDVKLLIEDGIIENNMGSISEITRIFNNLAKHVKIGCVNFSYYRECNKMKEYCQHRWRWWMTLKYYFGTPRVKAFFIFVIIVLALNLVRTIAYIISLNK